jgi:hypothetical protein
MGLVVRINTFFIMARVAHTNQESPRSSNPTTKYLAWKSVDKQFSYYDKASGDNIAVELPLRFVFLQHYHTIKGWNDSTQTGIYSNEVFYIGKEPLTVQTFKGKAIASGIYKDIKQDVVAAGGKYHRSVYVMLEDGSVANISLKGAVVKEWSDFMEASKNLVDNQWVEVASAKDEKKGSVKYSVPVFSLGKPLTKEASNQADQAADALKTHMDAYFSKGVNDIEVEEAETLDLEF